MRCYIMQRVTHFAPYYTGWCMGFLNNALRRLPNLDSQARLLHPPLLPMISRFFGYSSIARLGQVFFLYVLFVFSSSFGTSAPSSSGHSSLYTSGITSSSDLGHSSSPAFAPPSFSAELDIYFPNMMDFLRYTHYYNHTKQTRPPSIWKYYRMGSH